MTIEIAPIEYHDAMTWNQAKLYLFALNIDGKIDWRLPTRKEFSVDMHGLYLCWVQEDRSSLMDSELDTLQYICYPVRDVK